MTEVSACRSVVLDDDLTGVQACADLPVLLRWPAGSIAAALKDHASVHLMTNTRSLPASAAQQLVARTAAQAGREAPWARVVLRGDSTLRGHVWEEYAGVRDAVFPERAPVLLLVPALPSAGRVTRGGIHYLQGSTGSPIPLHETEYARDGDFAFRSARLREWADERSAGRLPAVRASELSLGDLRRGGPSAVAGALQTAAGPQPAVCAPDVETLADVRIVAEGLTAAERAGLPVIVRCGPTFAGVLGDCLAAGPVDAQRVSRARTLLICGSYVENTTVQLQALVRGAGVDVIEADPAALAAGNGHADREITALTRSAGRALDLDSVAVVATARHRPAQTRGLGAGLRIARGLAAVLAGLDPPPNLVIAKGGITSHVVLEHGLGAQRATVVGPLMPGVGLWNVRGSRGDSQFVVVPGNVGSPELLLDLWRMTTGEADA